MSWRKNWIWKTNINTKKNKIATNRLVGGEFDTEREQYYNSILITESNGRK